MSWVNCIGGGKWPEGKHIHPGARPASRNRQVPTYTQPGGQPGQWTKHGSFISDPRTCGRARKRSIPGARRSEKPENICCGTATCPDCVRMITRSSGAQAVTRRTTGPLRACPNSSSLRKAMPHFISLGVALSVTQLLTRLADGALVSMKFASNYHKCPIQADSCLPMVGRVVFSDSSRRNHCRNRWLQACPDTNIRTEMLKVSVCIKPKVIKKGGYSLISRNCIS